MICVSKSEGVVTARLLHTWTKWETFQSGHLQFAYFDDGQKIEPPIVRGYWERQRRECSVCGKRQLRKVTA